MSDWLTGTVDLITQCSHAFEHALKTAYCEDQYTILYEDGFAFMYCMGGEL